MGRRADLDVLSEKWASGAAGHGAAVLLAGEPGVGKSRLADQLRDLVSGQRYSWIDCSCSPYTQMSVLWPVARLIEHGLGLLEDDDPQTRLGRLRSGLGAAGVDLTDAVELVAAVLGLVQVEAISMAPDRRLERTVEVLVAWIRALSRPQPLVLLVEDLHWCDPTSLDVLDELMATIGSTSLLLLHDGAARVRTPGKTATW